MNSMHSLDGLLTTKLRILRQVETLSAEALLRYAAAVRDPDLRETLERHAGHSETNIGRLDEAFSLLHTEDRDEQAPGIRGLIEEGDRLAEDEAFGRVRDAGLLVAAQQIEHYRIAAYGSARTWADLLGHGRAARLLEAVLDDAKASDAQLTNLADTVINIEAEEAAE